MYKYTVWFETHDYQRSITLPVPATLGMLLTFGVKRERITLRIESIEWQEETKLVYLLLGPNCLPNYHELEKAHEKIEWMVTDDPKWRPLK